MDLLTAKTILSSASVIAAGLAMVSGIGVGNGQGTACAAAVTAVSRQPEAKGDITSILVLGDAIAESVGIYSLVIALILLYANPLLSKLG